MRNLRSSSTYWWRVAGILFLIGTEALLYGYSYPFFSLVLEERGLASWLIGFNASLAGVGILIFGPVLPALIARIGVRIVVIGLFLGSLLSFTTLLISDHLAVWFATRFVMGGCFAALWTTTEIWLNAILSDRHRGRVIGASGTLYAVCQFLGPLILGHVGVQGAIPIGIAMLPLALALVVAFSVSSDAKEIEEGVCSNTKDLRLAFSLAGNIIAAAFLGGVGETAMQSLLPIYGLAHGFDPSLAARLVATFSLGEALLVALLGWLADRQGRKAVLRLCTVTAIVTMLILPLVIASPFQYVVIFLAGGAISGIYTLGVILIGQDYQGMQLATVSTVFAMAYSAGSIIGATPFGLFMDVFGPEALPLTIAAGFAVLLLISTFYPSSHTRPIKT